MSAARSRRIGMLRSCSHGRLTGNRTARRTRGRHARIWERLSVAYVSKHVVHPLPAALTARPRAPIRITGAHRCRRGLLAIQEFFWARFRRDHADSHHGRGRCHAREKHPRADDLERHPQERRRLSWVANPERHRLPSRRSGYRPCPRGCREYRSLRPRRRQHAQDREEDCASLSPEERWAVPRANRKTPSAVQ